MKAKNGGVNAAAKLYRQTGSRDLARCIILREIGINGEKALSLLRRLDKLDVAIVNHYVDSSDHLEASMLEGENDLMKQIRESAS